MNKKKLLTVGLSLLCTMSGFAQYREVMWEKFNSISPNMLTIGKVENIQTDKIADSYWSIGCETLDRNYADYNAYKSYLSELGAKHARIQSGWAKCEPKKGKYDFEWLDVIVTDMKARHVQPWMVLCYGNPIYSSNEKLGAKIFTDKETMDGWLNYVRQTVKRYKHQIKEWEVWNEPNLGDNLKYPDAYANLLMKTVEVIKSEQPDAVIMAFALSGNLSLKFTKDVYEILKANNKVDIVDYLTFHPYMNNPDEARYNIDALTKLAKSYNPKVKLFQGENGCPSVLEWGHALNQHPWSEISQAKWFLRRMANDWSFGIRSSIFTLVDLQYFNMHQSFGLLRTNLEKKIVYKRPSYYAVKNMINLFPTEITASGRLAYKANTFKSIAIEGVKKDNQLIGALMWYDDKVPSDDLEWDRLDIEIKDLPLKDPVLVDVVTGKVYDMNKQLYRNMGTAIKLRDFPVWDSPMLLVERAHVQLQKGADQGQDKSNDKEELGIL
ncbi:beta-galactosidase [Sphingobacterium paucimobilis]|nr:beta-galactosidase [Sphingobacterium paucimobilis]